MTTENQKLLILRMQLVLIFSTLLISIETKLTNRQQTVMTQLCPFTDFCHANATEIYRYPEYEPCCSECSCADNCWETGSCCPDKDNVTSKSSELVCKSTMVKKRSNGRDTLFYDGFQEGIKRYLIVDRCPADNFKNSTIQQKCQGVNKSSLEDYVWVVDTVSGKIFQNRHCAICHGHKSWKSWNIRTQCNNVDKTSFESLEVFLFSKDCNIINEIPEDLEVDTEIYRCYIPGISVCNQTGLWTQFDQDINDGCATYTMPFFQIHHFLVDIYKNVFCYMCNTDQMDTLYTICPSRIDNIRVNAISFNALIDFSERTKEPEPTPNCAPDELYDAYAGICRKLFCPFGTRPYNSECQSLALSMHNLGIHVLLDLRIDWDLTTLPATFTTVPFSEGEMIFKKVYRTLGLLACTFCHVSLSLNNKAYSSQPETDFIMFLTLSTNPDCQLGYVHEKLTNAIKKKLSIPFAGRGLLVLTMRHDKRPYNKIFNNSTMIFYHSAPVVCNAGPVRFSEEFCPGIRLIYSDVASRLNRKARDSLISLFDSVPYRNENSTLFICLANYFRLMFEANNVIRPHSICLPILLAFIMVLCGD